MASGGVADVIDFLGSIGLANCVQAVVHNGFYTSMEALRGATYEELVDSGVRPVHAKLILSNLGSKSGFAQLGQAESGGAEEVASFLRSVGLDVCYDPLVAAGLGSLDALGRATLQELLDAGVKPVHARLIVSNLDSAASSASVMTPLRGQPLDEDTLLGGPRKRRSPTRLYACGGLVLLLLLLALVASRVLAPAAPAPGPAAPAAPYTQEPLRPKLHKGKGEGKGKGEAKGEGEGKHKGKGEGKKKNAAASPAVAAASEASAEKAA